MNSLRSCLVSATILFLGLGGCPRPPASSVATADRPSPAAPADSAPQTRPEPKPTEKRPTIRVVFWNVANLFHPAATGPGRPSGVSAVTEERYRERLARLAQGLLLAGDGRAPDVVLLAEVGSDQALVDLAGQAELEEAGYRPVRLDSPDGRGIGNAALTRLPLAAPPRHHLAHRPGEPPTRAVLELRLVVGDRELVALVNHWPSKRGGDRARALREAVAQRVRALVQRAAETEKAEILVAGDFNAHLNERVFDAGYLGATAIEADLAAGRALLFHTLDDAAERAFGVDFDDLDQIRAREPEAGFGTYVYRRRWATLDGILVHGSLLDGRGLDYEPGSAEIVRHPSLIYVVNRGRPSAYEKPDREVSDHLPVAIDLVSLEPE